MKAAAAQALRRLADRLDPSEAAADRRELHKTRSPGTPPLTPQKEKDSVDAVLLMVDAGFTVDIKNGGLHLQIKDTPAGLVDYWPTSGRWWIGKTKKKGAGVRELLRELGVQP